MFNVQAYERGKKRYTTELNQDEIKQERLRESRIMLEQEKYKAGHNKKNEGVCNS